MTLLRAAPGQLLELVKAAKSAVPSQALVVRHSQGDHWDLMVLVPIESYAKHFGDGAGARPLVAPALVAWQEDEFVRGPDLSKIDNFGSARLIHVEMFNALAGKVPELVKEREMENAYLAAVGRPANAIFRRELGASWDVFTLGPYRDWRHYAERDSITSDKATAAAKGAGFASDEAIGDGKYSRHLIENAVSEAREAIAAHSSTNEELKGMGSTCAIAWIVADKLYTGYVGDSRMYLMRGGRIQQLTIDHTWVQEVIEKGIITPDMAHDHPNVHVIRRYLGSPVPPDPDFRLTLFDAEGAHHPENNQGVRLQPNDVVLLCSDGLTDLVWNDEILEVVRSNSSLKEATRALVDLANERGGHDKHYGYLDLGTC